MTFLRAKMFLFWFFSKFEDLNPGFLWQSLLHVARWIRMPWMGFTKLSAQAADGIWLQQQNPKKW